jgi:hypothetical protein
MAKKTPRTVYRVLFHNQGKVFEVYARAVLQGGLFGFIELEELVFGEKSALLVDPAEEGLRKEFENTKRVFIPMHSVIRIDELEKDSAARSRVLNISERNEAASEAAPGRITPIYTPPAPPDLKR